MEPIELAALLAALVLLASLVSVDHAERERRIDRRLAYARSEEYV